MKLNIKRGKQKSKEKKIKTDKIKYKHIRQNTKIK